MINNMLREERSPYGQGPTLQLSVTGHLGLSTQVTFCTYTIILALPTFVQLPTTVPLILLFHFSLSEKISNLTDQLREENKKLSEMEKVKSLNKRRLKSRCWKKQVLPSGSKQDFYYCDKAGLHSSSSNNNTMTLIHMLTTCQAYPVCRPSYSNLKMGIIREKDSLLDVQTVRPFPGSVESESAF